MSSGKKQATGTNDDITEEVEELSGTFSGSEVKMSDVKDDDDEDYSMTLNNEDDFNISTSFK